MRGMVTHRVLIFGPLSAKAGTRELNVSAPADACCGQIRAAILAERGELAGLVNSSRFAVQHSFVSDDFVPSAGDEIALICPVSGG